VAGHDAPPSGDLDVGRETADDHVTEERVCIAGHIDDRDGVSERIRDVQRAAVGAEREVAWIGALEIGAASGDRRDLRELRPLVDAERPYLIVEAIGRVQSRSILVEDHILRVETRLEFAEHRVGAGVDDRGKVGVFVDDDDVRPCEDGGIERRNRQARRPRRARGPCGPQVDPPQHAPRGNVNHCDAPVRISFAARQRDVQFRAVRRYRQGVRPAAHGLRHVWPMLFAARHLRIIGIDPGAGVGAAIEVIRAEHDLGKTLNTGALARELGPDDRFDGIVGATGNDFAARIGFDSGGEKSEVERRFWKRARHDLPGKGAREVPS